jgi:hypothetical protein
MLTHAVPFTNAEHSAPRTPLFRYANCYGCSNPAFRHSAKSIAPCRMHLQKKLLKNLQWWAAMRHKPLSELLFGKILNCETASLRLIIFYLKVNQKFWNARVCAHVLKLEGIRFCLIFVFVWRNVDCVPKFSSRSIWQCLRLLLCRQDPHSIES